MKKIMRKVVTVMLMVFMMIGLVQMPVHAASSNSTINYNVPYKTVPFIYAYSNSQGKVTLSNGNKTIPDDTYMVSVCYYKSRIAVDKTSFNITVNGSSVINYTVSDTDPNYVVLSFMTSSNGATPLSINVDVDYQLPRNFSVRVRKILSGVNNNPEMEEYIKNDPAEYLLYNEDKSLIFSGTIDTGDTNSNFVHWTLIEGSDNNYISNIDDSRVSNLPNGNYTVMETKGTTGLKTIDWKSSSSVWLNSSFINKDSQTGNLYYTFSITNDTVNEWMTACGNGEANSLFYGFYTELQNKYNVTYNGNGANGQMEGHQDVFADSQITVKDNGFNYEGYKFINWNTVQNPTVQNPGVAYEPDHSMTVSQNVTLYAQWEKIINVAHSVYVEDLVNETAEWKELAQTTLNDSSLAYTDAMVTKLVDQYKLNQNYSTGYKTSNVRVEIKENNNWVSFDDSMTITDGTEIRYVVTIEKDLEMIKTISYKVEHWLEGEDTPRDVQTISKNIWVNDQTNNLTVEKINLNNYEGYTFSHYEPTKLPETVISGTTIRVIYNKTPIIPEVPEVPTTPEVPEIPVTPEVSETPVIPVTPTTPTVNQPVTEITITPNINTPVTTPVVETPNVPANNVVEEIEEVEVPLANPEVIEENDVPLAANIVKGQWALVNLLSMIITVLIAIIALFFKHKKEEDNEEEKKNEEDEQSDVYYRRRWTKVIMILLSICSIIVFFLTENILLPMVLVDKWTWLMVVGLIIQIVLVVFSRNWKNDNQEKQPQLEA